MVVIEGRGKGKKAGCGKEGKETRSPRQVDKDMTG
jgi:ribosomal protein L15